MINFAHLKTGKKAPPELLDIQKKKAAKAAEIHAKNKAASEAKNKAIKEIKSRPENGPSEPIKNRDKIELVKEVIGEERHGTRNGEIIINRENDFSPGKVDGKFKTSLIESGQVFEKSDPIVGTFYCFGCYRMSAEMMGTDREIIYCRRDITPDGDIPYIRIKPEVVIGQCKYRLDDSCPF